MKEKTIQVRTYTEDRKTINIMAITMGISQADVISLLLKEYISNYK
jgi:hypothetical protein